MIKLISRMMGVKNFYMMYQLLKQKEFIINMGTLGVMFSKVGEWQVEISIVALGKDFGNTTYLTQENIIKKEKVVVEKLIKPTTEMHEDIGTVEEEDLF